MKYENEIVLFVIVGSIVLFLLGTFMVSFLLVYQKRHLRFLQEKQALKAAYEKEILTAEIETQNQTLQYIGQELHDNLGQLLSLARLNLSIIDQEHLPETTQRRISDTKDIIKNAITDLRSISKSLDKAFLQEFGLVESITNEVNRISRTERFETHFSVQGTALLLDKQHEIILFRIIQEALNNILKHANASSISILLTYQTTCMELEIKDDGIGFNPEQLDLSKGSGIRNLKSRAQLIGGECHFISSPNQGTCLHIKVQTISA